MEKIIKNWKSLIWILAMLIYAGAFQEARAYAPSVSTGSAQNITIDSADLWGEVTDPGDQGDPEVYFEWHDFDYYNVGSCYPGTGTGPFSCYIGSLQPGVDYYFSACASNIDGSSCGSEEMFTTYIQSPSVTTLSAQNITQNSADLRGEIIATGGQDPSRKIEWGTSSGVYTDSCFVGSFGVGEFSCSVTGLASNTTYYFIASGENINGTTYGEENSFTTSSQVSTVITGSAQNITASGADLGGEITNTGGEDPNAFIEWGLSSGIYTQSCSAGTNGLGGFSCNAYALIPNTTYYWRAGATNSAGTSHGNEGSFTTENADFVISTSSVTNISATTAQLNANVTYLQGDNPERFIEWRDLNEGSYTHSCTQGVGGLGAYSCAISGFTPDTTYYVRAKGVNSLETNYGEEFSFHTPILIVAPSVGTNAVSNISYNLATLNGTVTNRGNENATRVIEYGTTSGAYTSSCSAGVGGVGNFSCNITNLLPNTTYYVRAQATNSAGTGYGDEVSFTGGITTNFASSAEAYMSMPFVINGPLSNFQETIFSSQNYASVAVDDTNYVTTAAYSTNESCDTVTDIDGNSYSTITVGGQCWMKANLKTTRYPDYSPIMRSPTIANWDGADHGYYAYPGQIYADIEETPEEANRLGYLYQWSAATWSAYTGGLVMEGTRGICPLGWHLPTNNEFLNLQEIVDATYGSNANSFWANFGWSHGSSAFNNLAGSRFPDGDFGARSSSGIWTSTNNRSWEWYAWGNITPPSIRGGTPQHTANANSVRCIKNSYHGAYAAQLYTFDTTAYANPSELEIKLLAYGTGNVVINGVQGKIWNNRTLSWNFLSSLTHISSTMPSSAGTHRIISNISDYVDSNKKVKILVHTLRSSISTNGANTVLKTDYIGLNVWMAPSNSIVNPMADTKDVTDIDSTSAMANVNLVNTGGESPTRGAQWGTESGIYTDSCTIGIGGAGDYSCLMSNLSPDTTYYLAAYVQNSAGSSYGEEITFQTLPDSGSTVAPTLTTSPTTLIRSTTATGNANLSDTGGENPTRGIQWGTQSGIYTNSCTLGTEEAGSYSCALTGLSPETTYYYRATATNSAGTTNGTEMSFTTLPNSIVIVDPNPTKMTNALSSNYFSLNSGVSSATSQTANNIQVTFQTSMASLTLPPATQITKSGGGNFNFQNFVTENKTSEVQQLFVTSKAAVKVGVRDTKIAFSNPVTISINVSPTYNGQSMYVFYQNDGETNWVNQTTCVITAGTCSFLTNHATTYSVNGDGSMVGQTGINLNTDVQEVIALDCGTSIVNMGNLTPGVPVTGSSTCLTTTNSNGGYNLSVRRDDSTDTTMDKTTEEATNITDKTSWNPAIPNAQSWTGTGLGFTVYDSTANKNTTWWGTGSTVTDSNNLYAGFAPTQTDIMRHTTYSDLGTTTSIGYKLDVEPSQKSGAYSGAITYQVTTTP